MVPSHIEHTSVAASEFSAEIDESVEMNSSVSVSLSCHDALCSKFSTFVDNLERIETLALSVSKEGVTKLELHADIMRESRGPLLFNVIATDSRTQTK